MVSIYEFEVSLSINGGNIKEQIVRIVASSFKIASERLENRFNDMNNVILVHYDYIQDFIAY